MDNTLLNVSQDCELLHKERCAAYLQLCPHNDDNLNLTQMIIVDNWASIDDNIDVKAGSSLFKSQHFLGLLVVFERNYI